MRRLKACHILAQGLPWVAVQPSLSPSFRKGGGRGEKCQYFPYYYCGCSVAEHMALIIIYAIALEEHYILLTEILVAVVHLLPSHILTRCVNAAGADGKRAITGLPRKTAVHGRESAYIFVSRYLHALHQSRHVGLCAEAEYYMYMVAHSTHGKGVASDVVKNSGDICEEVVKVVLLYRNACGFDMEYQMNVDLRQ